MKRPPLLLVALLVAAALVLSACSGGASGYAYVFDGKTTTQATVDRELKALAGNKLFGQALSQSSSGVKLTNTDGSISSQVSAAWVNALVQYEAIDQAMKQGKITVTASDRQQAASQAASLFGGQQIFAKFPKWFQDLELAREARKVAFVRASSKAPSEADALAYYAKNASAICASGKVVFHILTASQQAAQSVENQLKVGGDFAKLAQQSSTDTQSGAQGGLLGCLQSGQAPAEYDAAIAALAPGQVSAPVQSQYGWSVIKVEAPSYAVLAPLVRSALDQRSAQQVTGQIGKRVEKATLKVNPRYGKIKRSTSGLQIVPQTPPQVRNVPSTTTSLPAATPGAPTPVSPTPTATPQPAG